jgi:dienelactone hydrolase
VAEPTTGRENENNARSGFTNPEADRRGQPERARYDAKADARSWTEMCAFFEEILRLPIEAGATSMT